MAGTALRQLDLFSGTLEQGSIEREVITEHLPISSVTDPYAPITFVLPFSALEYFNIQDTLLRMRVKFNWSTDAGANPNWTKICPVNMLMHSMIRNIDLEINGKLVTSSSQYYPYLAALQTKLRITDESKKGFMTACGFYEDHDIKDSIVGLRRAKLEPADAGKESKTYGWKIIPRPCFSAKTFGWRYHG
jgi:hypothetical protein